MRVVDVMTTKIVSVRPDMPVPAIANLLLEKGISAVPVLNDDGAAIGMISEGDLLPRNETERDQRRDWWLRMLAEGEKMSADYIKDLESDKRIAREIMITPTITIEETADVVEAAELMSERRIKRLPVVRNGRVVGIISRADLVRAVARGKEPMPSSDANTDVGLPPIAPIHAAPRPAASPAPSSDTQELSAKAFHSLVEHFEEEKLAQRAHSSQDLAERRRQEAKEVISTPLTEERWKHLLSSAQAAARKGETESLLVRFPCEACTDHGRAVNAPDPNWPETLRGLPAKIFLRWREELRPRGFVLHARVLEFHDGLPGDIGLFLAWS